MIDIGDMYYATTNDDSIRLKAQNGGAVTTLMRHAIEAGFVDAAVVMVRGTDLYDGVPTVVTRPEQVVRSAGSLFSAHVNMGKFIADHLDGARDLKVAVSVKPCDARTLVRLAQMGKVNLDNVIMIGLNCGGTVHPVKTRELIEQMNTSAIDDIVNEEIASNDRGRRRDNCLRCETKIPYMTDIVCGNWGVVGPQAGRATFVEVRSGKGARLLQSTIDAGLLSVVPPDPKGIEIRNRVGSGMAKLALRHQAEQFSHNNMDIDYWAKEFSKCIKCMGCILHCPVAYDAKLNTPEYESRGRLPPAFTYHVVKAAAVGRNCVNCGCCDDVCPVDIPISKLYHDVQKRLETD
jgi:formate dehydrogenase subunit beta